MLPRLRSLVIAALATLTAALMVVWWLPGRLPASQSLAMHTEMSGRLSLRHGDTLRRALSLQIGPAGAVAHEPTFRPRRGGVGVFSELEFTEARPAAAPPLVRLASLSVHPTRETERVSLVRHIPVLPQVTVVGPMIEARLATVRIARLADPEEAPEVERIDGLPVVVARDIEEPATEQTGTEQTGATPPEPASGEPAAAVEPPSARAVPVDAPWPRQRARKGAKPNVQPGAARKPRAPQKATRAPARPRAAPQPTQQQLFPYYDGSQTPQTQNRSRRRSANQPPAEKPWWE